MPWDQREPTEPEDLDGTCPDCGEETFDGVAYQCCQGYGVELCDTCHHTACDKSC